MSNVVYKAFFSYSHIDGAVDPELFKLFTNELQQRTTAKLTNAEFEIWVDHERLKIGYNWNEVILNAVSSAHVLIVLLSPKWVQSDYCRKELRCFLKAEGKFFTGEFIAPVMTRDVSPQKKYFSPDQKECYDIICERQYHELLSQDLLGLSPNERSLLIEKVADDLAGMIERHRAIDKSNLRGALPLPRKPAARPEFDRKAHNYESTDFISDAELYVDPIDGDKSRGVFAHVGFIPRMYIQHSNVRIEFGIQRAVLSITSSAPNELIKDSSLSGSLNRSNAYYINWRLKPNAISICMDPLPGSFSLQELPLPPGEGENRLSRVAAYSSAASFSNLTATLSVALSSEGIYVFGEDNAKPSQRLLKKIQAIAGVAIAKDITTNSGHVERQMPVRERKK